MRREEYVRQLIEEDPVLQKVRLRIADADMPEISVTPEWGQWLTMLVRMVKAETVLEIGALGGYSGTCLARGLGPSGRLVSLEIDERFAEFARENLVLAGLERLVEYRVGNAIDTLPKLVTEGEQFDVVFIDADKGNYPQYLEWAIKLSRSGSVIVADNVMLHDRVLDPDDHRPSTVAIRQFNEQIMHDPRLDSLLIPFHDGMAVAYVK